MVGLKESIFSCTWNGSSRSNCPWLELFHSEWDRNPSEVSDRCTVHLCPHCRWLQTPVNIGHLLLPAQLSECDRHRFLSTKRIWGSGRCRRYYIGARCLIGWRLVGQRYDVVSLACNGRRSEVIVSDLVRRRKIARERIKIRTSRVYSESKARSGRIPRTLVALGL